MASPGGTSSGSSSLVSEEELQALKKQKRMISNRESARRSRMRKQKKLDDLAAQVGQLRKENGHILRSLSFITQQYFAVEAENSVLRTQMMELGSRLQSLGEILHCLNSMSCDGLLV
ncbi:bZIP transcription factor 11-like [Canna indica]|uniref:BZIP transcription factor 11-like n=1 Tax=Canna indica TaxID=4628 RepID=A0AAQ3QLW9_9LILI|nr:bZIP transcription factor 11-like [Canna indica]